MIQKIRRRLNRMTAALASRGFPVTINDRYLASLQGKYSSKKAVIIGTGPSLRVEDLDRLSGWFSFACNKIYLAFENTSWRPDVYSISDIKLAEEASQFDLRDYFSKTTIINSYITQEAFKPNRRLYHYRYSEQACISKWHPDTTPNGPSSFADGILPGGNSVMIDQLQMAYLMGFREVAIIGADLSYFAGTKTGETCRSGELIRYEGNEAEKNYFHKNYYQPGAVTTVPNVDKMKTAWEYCRLLFESSGRKLINASRQSALEHVTRATFDDLFSDRPPTPRTSNGSV
jgi:hypothetical protein